MITPRPTSTYLDLTRHLHRPYLDSKTANSNEHILLRSLCRTEDLSGGQTIRHRRFLPAPYRQPQKKDMV